MSEERQIYEKRSNGSIFRPYIGHIPENNFLGELFHVKKKSNVHRWHRETFLISLKTIQK